MVKRLRNGFTTGTCATAAAKAAILSIINQKKIESVTVNLPKNKEIVINIKKCKFSKGSAICSVIKDGGDDPDVTHGAEIISEITLTKKEKGIIIEGGQGVGRVTKLGLGLEIGHAAINPVPKKMIRENLTVVGNEILQKSGIEVVISVPNGKELAKKTDNPRLGIMGGISILGTSGIVIPYSTASFAAAIRQNLDVAVAMDENEVVMTTGGRSEDFIKEMIKLPEHCFVQMGDFSGYAIQQCLKKKIKKITIAGFIGKFAKIANGVKQTHVKGSKVDMKFLSDVAVKCNVDKNIMEKIRNANTARNVQEIVLDNGIEGFFEKICSDVFKQMTHNIESQIEMKVILFNFDGSVLAKYPK